jgi:BFD-like [2Fe-2S] binding domain
MKNRLVCECFNIYVDDIKSALENGAETYEDIERKMKLGVMCSACIKDGKNVVDELNRELGRM